MELKKEKRRGGKGSFFPVTPNFFCPICPIIPNNPNLTFQNLPLFRQKYKKKGKVDGYTD